MKEKTKTYLHLHSKSLSFDPTMLNLVLFCPTFSEIRSTCKVKVLKSYGIKDCDPFESFQESWTLYPILVKKMGNFINQKIGIKNIPLDWEILIGYWLIYLLDIFVHKKKVLKYALKKYNISKVSLVQCKSLNLSIGSTYDFLDQINDSKFHEKIYSILYQDLDARSSILWSKLFSQKENKLGLTKYTNEITDEFTYSFCETQFSVKRLRELLNEPGHDEIPIIRPFTPKLVLSWRLELQDWLKINNLCDPILAKILAYSLPSCFLEGYLQNQDKAKSLFPKNKGLIFTSNSFAHNDLFKFWVIDSKRKGSKYIIGQHGNNYGTPKWYSSEKYERRVADKFISWGWKEKNSNIIALPSIQLNDFRKVCPKPNFKSSEILFISYSIPIYQYCSLSMPQAELHSKTMKSWPNFINRIKNNKIIFRPFKYDYGWHEKKFIKENTDENVSLKISEKINLIDDLEDVCMCVIAYNSTTILQLTYADFPFICFWNPNHWQIKSCMKKRYQYLKNCGILHDCAESAADFINNLNNQISEWWNSNSTKSNLRKFCQSFLEIDHQPEKKWESAFQEILKN